MSNYLIVIEREGNAWGAYAPDLPGLGVAGSSQEEVEQLAEGAIKEHIQLLKDLGEPVPPPSAQVRYVSLT